MRFQPGAPGKADVRVERLGWAGAAQSAREQRSARDCVKHPLAHADLRETSSPEDPWKRSRVKAVSTARLCTRPRSFRGGKRLIDGAQLVPRKSEIVERRHTVIDLRDAARPNERGGHDVVA